eukprot:CAMPEP_0184648648 /NCGR_PEP_ID=MMETSP0308-20130426/5814_1 /TAXON_ID=38269 /ORGANISM="Gloeochaete witrockiana, Strain SAG 46.84" /LENGTH=287 /DNA_ID=CAMNT_0027080655 /DNA_START=583 /DNA_END=1443 /DNA_ORIENTATION=-
MALDMSRIIPEERYLVEVSLELDGKIAMRRSGPAARNIVWTANVYMKSLRIVIPQHKAALSICDIKLYAPKSPPPKEYSKPQFFYGQWSEDEYVYELLFRNNHPSNRKGLVVEIGALDGVTFSNSLFFQEFLGWDAVLIEPQEQQFKNLVKNRPNARAVHAAVCEQERDLTFWTAPDIPAVSGALELMTDRHKADFFADGKRRIEHRVKCLPLHSILGDNITHIDFLSVDCEGCELEALRSMRWSIPVSAILVEVDGKNGEKDAQVREALVQHGFTYLQNIYISELW